MMICPNAKGCKDNGCFHIIPHEENSYCNRSATAFSCPKCITTEVEMKDIKVGDFVENDFGTKRKVLGRMGDLVGLSYPEDFRTIYRWATIDKFIDDGYRRWDELEKRLDKLQKLLEDSGRLVDGKVIK